MSAKTKLRSRYSIGEWYGVGFENLSPMERRHQAKIEIETDNLVGKRCPFVPNSNCNKKGGVCSIRSYQQINVETVHGVGPIITTCPRRFLEGNEIFRWIGKEVLGTDDPIVLSEIGFLDKLRTKPSVPEDDLADFVGRIDNVLVHPEKSPIEWCALETQAVYFSGHSMKKEFNMLATTGNNILPFPAAHRRPDWRSSGPKRLLPQLQTKTPTIRTWGKKIAVVIDEAFFNSLVGLDEERHLSNSEIVWFVVAYEPADKGWNLVRKQVVYTKLDASVKALTGGVPLSKEAFEAQLIAKVKTTSPSRCMAQWL